MIKGTAMAQWVNCFRNNIFVNPPPLPLLCEISGALHLAQLGLTAGRQVADKMQVNFEIFKTNYIYTETFDFSLRLTKVQDHYSSTNAFQALFRVKSIARLFFKVQKFMKPYDFLPIPKIKYYRT